MTKLTNDSEKIAMERIAQAKFNKSTSLDLSNLNLTYLPESIGELSQISTAHLSLNKLSKLPESFGELKSLSELFLSHNKLTELPKTFSKLQNLRGLSLGGNQFSSLPPQLRAISNLSYLNIDDNSLVELPDWIEELTNLKILFLSKNKLNSIPNALQNLPQLEQIFLHENNELGLPLELLGPRWEETTGERAKRAANPRSILNYYFHTRGGSRPLNEAKLILVGRGEVGKTSLVKRLLSKDFNAEEKKTDGIQITLWDAGSTADPMRLHVWDFGGQEIMHATHQFFLTERSLYLLVLNGREGGEDYDVEYWLKLISSFGADSPVIIVMNKVAQHPFDLNYRALQAKYTQVQAFIKTDCKELIGIAELRDAIQRSIDVLSRVRAKFPTAWFAIKNKLARMKEELRENFIGYDRYRALCRELGETNEKAQDDLAEVLHCLGIALNYKDDPRLRDMSVLNPHWVTSGIYRLLNARVLSDNKGVLRVEDLESLLPPKDYPREKHAFLLELMRKFKLCFAFPDDIKHRYLIPELLDKQEPELHDAFQSRLCLNFEYHYSILPEGLLPSFIVRTHVLSTNQPRWRSGVILNWEGCQALVKADTAERRIVIRVQGAGREERRRLLAVIRSDFERIHQEISKLEWIERVPVPGTPQVAIEYKKLHALERAGEVEIKEFIDGEIVSLNIKDMLNGVDLKPTSLRNTALESNLRAVQVFISYSHKDELFRDELETHMKLLHRQGEISTWSDRKLLAGEVWGEKIEQKLESADVVLLLVSASFLSSDYCYGVEMKRALERHTAGATRVIPVIVKDCDWRNAPFAKLQPLPRDGKAANLWRPRDKAWTDVILGIRKIIAAMRQQSMY